jgi:D-methionine transport system substrate-binding protein
MLELIAPELAAQGIDLEIVVTDDYQLGNRALADGQVDANFFQHTPFLEAQIKQFNYPIESLVAVHIEPMALYSKKVKALFDLPERSTIAIPNDPTNEARALMLLQGLGLVQLKEGRGLNATVWDVRSNPLRLELIEIDPAMLPRTLDDVTAAVINANYALSAGLSPQNDSLAIEDSSSPYANIVAIRTGEASRPELQALRAALQSATMKQYILEKYKGALQPVHNNE